METLITILINVCVASISFIGGYVLAEKHWRKY